MVGGSHTALLVEENGKENQGCLSVGQLDVEFEYSSYLWTNLGVKVNLYRTRRTFHPQLC